MGTAKEPGRILRRLVKNWAVPSGCGLLFLFLLRFVFFFGYVPSASMEPAIREGSFIFGIRLCREPQCGDVVVFKLGGRLLVKRITGAPGDAVTMADGAVLTVPDGYCFMTGDNAAVSFDSRYWEEPFIARESITAVIPVY